MVVKPEPDLDVPFTSENCARKLLTCIYNCVGDDVAQLCVHRHQYLLHVQDMPCLIREQCLSLAGDRSQSADVVSGAIGTGQQAVVQ